MAYDYDKEREEAIRAGECARESLQKALESLDSARSWGICDILTRGGILIPLLKRSKMDKASACIEEAKASLESFSRELRDVREYAQISITTDDFWGFADWFFDGGISDWIMQSRINDARGQVRLAIDKVYPFRRSSPQ